MTQILFIEYPRCSTCQKAKKWLDEQGLEYIDRDIVNNTPTVDELKQWSVKSDIPIRKLFNTSGIKCRELGLKDKIPTMSDDEILATLASDGMLIKRPLIVRDGTIVLKGFNASKWNEVLLSR